MTDSPERRTSFEAYIATCLALANEAAGHGDVPVGALVLDPGGQVIATGYNTREAHHDPAGHAEIEVLRKAAHHLGTSHLDGCTLVVSLEPCTMCAGAIVLARISTLVFGAWDEKAGAAGSVRDVVRDSRLNHQVEVVGGINASECAAQLSAFFAERR